MIDRYEAESIAQSVADRACRALESDIRYDYQRAIEELKHELRATIRETMRDHVSESHSE